MENLLRKDPNPAGEAKALEKKPQHLPDFISRLYVIPNVVCLPLPFPGL